MRQMTFREPNVTNDLPGAHRWRISGVENGIVVSTAQRTEREKRTNSAGEECEKTGRSRAPLSTFQQPTTVSGTCPVQLRSAETILH